MPETTTGRKPSTDIWDHPVVNPWALEAISERGYDDYGLGMLYDLYADDAVAAQAAGTLGYEPILSHRDFGLTLQSLGFPPKRDSDGNYYEGLTYETRAERADVEARRRVGARCGHTTPMNVPGFGTLDLPVWHACPDLPTGAEARVQAIIEDEYRPLLDWRLGEPEPYREPPGD